MTTIASQVPAAPPKELRYRRYLHVVKAVRELWQRRELVWTLAERDLRARYKQASFGFAWALITPIALMVVFTLFLKRVANIDTGDVPYPLFAYVGLLPWGLFATSITSGGQSLIGNIPILKKVACPREVFPLSSVIVATVDMMVSLVALGVLFLVYGYAPRATTYWVPLILLVQYAFTIGVLLIVSSAMVYVRDLKHALPMVVQLGLFATPVAYGMDAIPDSVRGFYGALNPLAPVIDGYRRAVLQGLPPDWDMFIPAAGVGLVVLVLGYMIFKKLEAGIADVA